MDDLVHRNLAQLAGVFVLISATVHVYVGVDELVGVAYATEESNLVLGLLYLFAAVMLYALLAVYLVGRIRPTQAYLLGAGLLVLYILAYADYHVLGHAEAVLPLEAAGLEHDHAHHHDHGHSHDHSHGDHDHSSHAELTGLDLFVQHLLDDTAALVAKLSEFVGAIILAVLAVGTVSDDEIENPL